MGVLCEERAEEQNRKRPMFTLTLSPGKGRAVTVKVHLSDHYLCSLALQFRLGCIGVRDIIDTLLNNIMIHHQYTKYHGFH